MKYMLTLIGNPLTRDQVAAVRAALPAAGEPDWLAADTACDLPIDEGDAALHERTARLALADAPVDLIAQPAAGRRRKLLIADMDSTIITVECIDELADMIGRKAEVAAITETAMRGEIDFAGALSRRAAMLAGLPTTDLARCYAERVRLSPGARTLVQTMRHHGAHTALVSGGFSYFTERVRAAAGFHEDQANRLEIADGALTGTIQAPILDATAKLGALRRLLARHGLAADESLAVGDGANDRPMIEAAGLGVAYRAKPVLAEAARARIDHNDLTALLYMQGYRADELKH